MNNQIVEHWFACRVFHQQMKKIEAHLREESLSYYIPMRLVQEEKDNEIVYRKEAILPSLIFIRTSEERIKKYCSSSHLRAYSVPGTSQPAVISDREMNTFMDVLSKGCRQLEIVDQKLVKGNRVRIVGGWFKGSEGYIIRVHGTKRFVVYIDGVAAVATTFIPKEFIEKIE